MTAQPQADNFSVKLVTLTYTTISRKYYYAGGERLAVNSSDTGLAWLLSDPLGSTTKVIRASDDATISETRYKPWDQSWMVKSVLKIRCQPLRSPRLDHQSDPRLRLCYNLRDTL